LCETFAKGSIDTDKKSISGGLNLKKRVWFVNGKTKLAPQFSLGLPAPGGKIPGFGLTRRWYFNG